MILRILSNDNRPNVRSHFGHSPMTELYVFCFGVVLNV